MLKTAGLDLSSTDEIGTAASLIEEIAKLSKLNPILVTAAGEFCEQPNWRQSFPAPGMQARLPDGKFCSVVEP